MKRFVIISPPNSKVVLRIEESASTKEAAELCDKIHKDTRGQEVAGWVKAESLEELAEANPYVKIFLLEKELAELKKDQPEGEAPRDPKKFWSNGKPKRN